MREREGEKAGDETAVVKKRTTKIYSMCGCLSTAVTVVYKHSCNTSCNTIMCVLYTGVMAVVYMLAW